MKPIWLIVWILAVAGTALAADTSALTVAVYDFPANGTSINFNRKVTSLITADLAEQTNIILVERSELEKALGEQSLGASGLVSADAAARVGALTGAKVLVLGKVINERPDLMVLIANIVSTENARLFATKVSGSPGDLIAMVDKLAAQVDQIIVTHATNLVFGSVESPSAIIDRAILKLPPTPRPLISIYFHAPTHEHMLNASAIAELGVILQKAGFELVDQTSERKPDIEITGIVDCSSGQLRGGLWMYQAVIDLKARDRRTGVILDMEHEEGTVLNSTKAGSQRAAFATTVDQLAPRLLPHLLK